MSRAKWEYVGGCDTNPGVWDVGGAVIYVQANSRTGVVRREKRAYSGRSLWVAYWPAGSSTGAYPAEGEGDGCRTPRRASKAGEGREVAP